MATILFRPQWVNLAVSTYVGGRCFKLVVEIWYEWYGHFKWKALNYNATDINDIEKAGSDSIYDVTKCFASSCEETSLPSVLENVYFNDYAYVSVMLPVIST